MSKFTWLHLRDQLNKLTDKQLKATVVGYYINDQQIVDIDDIVIHGTEAYDDLRPDEGEFEIDTPYLVSWAG